jgi:CDP-diacylglycerol--glycerol-3-phosphate 3-phosphatidyltransferase
MTGSIISQELRARVRGVATPIATGFGRLGLTPNHLTLIGFGIAVLAGVAAGGQAWLAAGLLVIFGGVFDLFDGALARATGKASKLGAFMDSVFDRAGEAVIYVGVAAGCNGAGFDAGAILAAAAMAGAFMVSYTRAKSESLGFTAGTGMAAIGIAPREVRIVILTVGLLAASLLGGGAGLPTLSIALGLIAILAIATTIQRIVHVIRQASSKEHQ